jgi:glc operon protein GlcG
MTVTLREAEKVLQAAEGEANDLGVRVSVAVLDSRGDIVALARLDGARYFTPDVAIGKALVSAALGASSAAMAEAANSPIFSRFNEMHQNRMVFHQGAVPITRDGKVIGAVGVSGASAAQDEEVAKAGVEAL